MAVGRLARRLRPYVPAIAIAACALWLAWTFAYGVLYHTRPFGLPLDDAYIYLTYAKQLGRGEPFTYFSGGGFSAGATSVLWPMVLAPFWALGARGHALVWVSFGLCAALYALTLVGGYRLVRDLVGGVAGQVLGAVGAAFVLGIAPFAWTSLAGMEVAFASALLVWMLILLVRAPREGPPSRRLIACLAATALARPEAMLLVGFVCVAVAVARGRRRAWCAAAWWLAPLAAPLAWLVANKLFAGQLGPNTSVAKSHFYLPGFDWTYWWDAVITETGQLASKLFWDAKSPLVWPRLVALGWLVGAVRVAMWARREQRALAGCMIVATPLALMLAVIASSGAWEFHNYRYIAPAFPPLFVVVACALAPPRALVGRGPRGAWLAAAGVLAVLFLRSALPGIRADIAMYAQSATDLNRQVVAIGQHVRRALPDARIMFHDAGAIAYYGDTRVFDMLGLVTNHQAGIANHGPGARFELLESLPPARRPTHFAYYPSWMGQREFFGEVVRTTPLPRPFHVRRLVGDTDMHLIAAVWHHAHTAERPLASTAGWRMVDRVDLADLASERAHGWVGALGRRNLRDATARWTVFHREVHRAHGLLLDGGRTIRAQAGRAAERFSIHVDPRRPVRLVLRTGGHRGYTWNEDLYKAVPLEIRDARGAVLGRATLPPPSGAFVEVTIELRVASATPTLHVHAPRPYRAFHWFVLQPEP